MDAIIRRRVMGSSGGIDYSQQYLTIESTSDNNGISWVNFPGATGKQIYYSIDNGGSWTSATSSSEGTVLATLNTGDKLLIKGNNSSYCDTQNGPAFFYSTGTYIVYGNIMSLIYGDNFTQNSEFIPNTTLVFSGLFFSNPYLTSAENLVLPATELVEDCYAGMFSSCESLITAPELPATTLVSGCCRNMFARCTSLTYIKCLATDISATDCTNGWVQSVAANGTFVKASSMNSWTTGDSGIPSGWNVENA